jgi:hypothetical protein
MKHLNFSTIEKSLLGITIQDNASSADPLNIGPPGSRMRNCPSVPHPDGLSFDEFK